MTGRKLGRQPRTFDQTVPHYSSLRLLRRQMAVQLPPIAPAINYFSGLPVDLGMMLNGPDPNQPAAPVFGCCTISAAHHAPQIWARGTGNRAPTTDIENIEDDYCDFCGYVKGDPSTDQGGVEQDVLKGWMANGMRRADGTRDILLGFMEIDPRNPADIRRAIAECGVVYFGAEIPETWTTVAGPGDSWAPSTGPSAGGHCFFAAGYDPSNIFVSSWGINALKMPDASLQYVDEAYALFSSDWMLRTGKTPFGLAQDFWHDTMQSIALTT